MLDSELKEDVTSNQHMELVIRFLKRAGQNLSPPFRVEIPSRRLSQADQKRILAKELCDFLHLYNKETVSQYQNVNQNLSTVQIDNRLFENFLRSASEADLEQMMTTYMKSNKNSAIHLGVNPKTSKQNSNQNQQGSEVGADQQAQTILPKQSIEDKTITFIQTISSNEQTNQKWATLSTQNDSPKRLLRASSASRQRNNQKRHEEIYKLYGVSRPLSAVVQHRKRKFISLFFVLFLHYSVSCFFILELPASGSSVPNNKLLTRERPNSANVTGEQGLIFLFYLTLSFQR